MAQDSVCAVSMVDSAPVFESRCKRIEIPEAVVKKLASLGWNTYATYAFCVQNHSDDKAFEDTVLKPVLADDMTHAAKLRRLFLESYTMTASDLKRASEATDTEQPRKLPPQEMNARLEILQAKLLPLKIQDRLEPSQSLVGLAIQMVEEQRVRYISWAQCTTRAQEINSIKEVVGLRVWQPDRSGAIKQVKKDPEVQAPVGSELEVHQALRRRGVAYAIGQVMSFSKHEELIALLFGELQREAPSGFHNVNLTQVAQADREIHVRLGEMTRGGLTMGHGSRRGIAVGHPFAKCAKASSGHVAVDAKSYKQGQAASAAGNMPDVPNAPKGAKRKRKSRGKKQQGKSEVTEPAAKKSRVPMPKQLIGGSPVDAEGLSLCFGYSLKTCKRAGKQCPKGLHKCVFCFGSRPGVECNAKKA